MALNEDSLCCKCHSVENQWLMPLACPGPAEPFKDQPSMYIATLILSSDRAEKQALVKADQQIFRTNTIVCNVRGLEASYS